MNIKKNLHDLHYFCNNTLKKHVLKFVFTGPESTGKSSVSKAVADYFQAQWFPEYAREYLTHKKGKYTFDDITIIAIEQEKTRKIKEQEGIKVYDTAAVVLFVWSTFKYGTCSKEIETLMHTQKFDHYFLCSPKNVPYEDDPLREHPQQREELFEIYKSQLKALQVDFTILEGSLQDRVKKAIEIIEKKTQRKNN